MTPCVRYGTEMLGLPQAGQTLGRSESMRTADFLRKRSTESLIYNRLSPKCPVLTGRTRDRHLEAPPRGMRALVVCANGGHDCAIVRVRSASERRPLIDEMLPESPAEWRS